MKILVTAGNIFTPTFDSVCHAVKKVADEIEAMHIFDTPQSAEHAEENGRSSRIRGILGPVDITTSLVNSDNLQRIVPNRLSRLIRDFGVDNIIVDLSNGQKITTSVLYAVSTISRIDQIYALEFHVRLTPDTQLSDLTYGEDWNYTRIHPLKEILNITQSSYVELIYYRDRIENIVSALEAKNLQFAVDARDRLEHSLVDYFTWSVSDAYSPERLERCVNGLGKICEDAASAWHQYCRREGLITTQANNFNAQVKQIISRWDKYRKEAADGNLDTTNENVVGAVVPTLAIDNQLETMRIYRNLASHSTRHYRYSKHDARLALDSTLLVLERLADSIIIA